MFPGVSLGHKVYYFFLALAATLGFEAQKSNNLNQLQSLAITLTCPSDIIVACPDDEPPLFKTLQEFILAGGIVSANCGIDTISFDTISTTLTLGFCNKVTSAVYIIEDSCGGLNTCIHNIIVKDEITPTINCPGKIVGCVGNVPLPLTSYSSWYNSLIADGGSITDNCSIDTSSFVFIRSDTTKSGNCIIQIQHRYSIMDSCDNEAICNQKFSIINNTFPTFTPALDRVLYVDQVCFVDTSVSSTGSIQSPFHPCGIGSISRLDIARSGCTGRVDTIFRIWRVTEPCGKATIDTQFLYLADTIRPSLDGPGPSTYTCADQIPVFDTDVFTSSDNCSVPLIRIIKDSTADSSCTNIKTIHRIVEAVDDCNNIARFTQIINIRDTLPPGILCPANITLLCNANVPDPNPINITSSDNCGGSVDVIHVKDSIADSTCVNRKNIYRIYQSEDQCMNIGRCIQLLRVNDSIPPTITCPATISVTCVTEVPAPDINSVLTSDACGLSVIVHVKDSVTDSTCVNKKTVRRIYSASDACMNTNRCIQLINVHDTIIPVITCPNDTLIECESLLPAIATSFFTSDNCIGILNSAFVKDSVADSLCPNQKNLFRLYQATDACMNIGSCIQKIVINDTTPPALVGVTNSIVLSCGQIYSYTAPTASDACGDVPVNTFIDTIPGSCIGNYLVLLQFSAEDVCNNLASRTDTIFYIDDMPPMISCPENAEIECVDNPYTSLDSFLLDGGSVNDNCGLDSNSFSFVGETITEENGLLTIEREYAISDLCGNSDTCTQILTSPICFIDLALKAVINGAEPFIVKTGEDVPACGIIYNQGFVNVDSIKVIQYLAPGVKIVSPDWISTSDTLNYCYYLTRSNGLLPSEGLKPGDTAKFNFTIHVPKGYDKNQVITILEINQAKDTFGNVLPDLDSYPDNDPVNDSGGVPLSPDDNKIDGDSRLGEDEDDADPILFYVYHPLTCIAGVNVTTSVDFDCEGCFSAHDLLKGILLPESFYKIELFNSFGQLIGDTCIGKAYLNQTITYKVSVPLVEKDNSCWGYIKLEDKTPPQIDCSNDTIFCVELNGLPAIPDVMDNCSGPAKVVVVQEKWNDYGCDSGEIKGVYIRTLEAHDAWGNVSKCDKKYIIQKIDLDSVVCAKDTSIDCKLEYVKDVRFTHPYRSGVPTIRGVKLWPNNPSCNNFVYYTDDSTKICGFGYKIIRTWHIIDHCTREEVKCVQHIKIEDKSAPVIDTIVRERNLVAGPHDCESTLYLDALKISDCSQTTQRFVFTYFLPDQINKVVVQKGTLPASIKIPLGKNHKIYIDITDACGHITNDSILVTVMDITPPTPVCDEFTQVTLDPAQCWARIAAADLDNGSHDNCCTNLHFAAAYMSDIEKARKDFESKIILECGDKEYWNNKAWYDEYINEWINCFIFKDTLDAGTCGTSQVVLRVYEACEVPGYDGHEFPCSPHAWYCYNTSWLYRVTFNQTFKTTAGTKDCNFKALWACKNKILDDLNKLNQYNGSYYRNGNPINKSCYSLFASPSERVICLRKPLYNDCMIQVLADDKISPVCEGLHDIIIYCDSVPYQEADEASEACGYGDDYTKSDPTWPGDITLKGYTSIWGYYGGSRTTPHDDHATSEPACLPSQRQSWSPIYCREWLELDRYDSDKKLDPTQMFFNPVWVDKKNAKRDLKINEFYILENCLIDVVNHVDQSSTDKCGTGWYQRTWTIKDKCGNTTLCTQKILVKHRSDFEVIFPADQEITCENINGLSTKVTGEPIITDDECEQVAHNFQDDTFYTVEDACFKIVRTWTLIDACQYDPTQHGHYPDVIVDDRLRANTKDRYCEFRHLKDNGDGYIKYTQIIKVIDTIAPVLTCKDTTICITGASCNTDINLPVKAKDNCNDDLWFNISIDQNNDGVYESVQNHVKTLKANLVPGQYHIKVDAIDHCTNLSTCTFNLTVKDCKAPTPYCLNGVATVIMPTAGSIEVWAKDLDKGSYDNCTASDKLRFSFTDTVSHTSRIFTCNDIRNGKLSVVEVNIWVHDEAGNKDFCRTYIQLEDNPDSDRPEGVCPDIAASLVGVQGTTENENKEPIEKVIVKTTSNGAGLPEYITTNTGKYSFYGIPYKGNVTIEPLRKDDPLNGVSTIDLVLIQKHILGQASLNSPYKLIAADVNNNGAVDVIDLLELRKLILGIYENIPTSDSWRFIPKSYTFADPSAPWSYPMKATLNAIDKDESIEFTGIKIGDVNSSAVPHNLIGLEARETKGGLVLTMKDQKVSRGEIVKIDITADHFDQYIGLQGTVMHDGFEVLNIYPGALTITRENIGVRKNQGHFTISWHQDKALSVSKNDILFTLELIANKETSLSESIAINSFSTKAESYHDVHKTYPLSIRFTDTHGKSITKSELYQNYPNPFKQNTLITMQLAQSGFGTLSICDIQGRVVKSISKMWEKGYNEIKIDKSILNTPGIWYYKFDSKFYNATRKMVLID